MLGVLVALALSGHMTLAVIGGGFRRSFGASATSPLVIAVPIIGGMLIIASLIWPDRRPLLHLTAVLVAALVVGCVLIARETQFVAGLGMLVAAAWLWFYYRTLSP
jgi:hypothetical protein